MTASGLIKDTLVIVMGEFGRSPQITKSNAGREHWPSVFTILMAGGRLAGGANLWSIRQTWRQPP